MPSYAPYVSLERRSILTEPLTIEEEAFYNDSSPEAIETHIQEKLKQINHTPLPGWHYRTRQINGQNHIEAFKRNKFTYNEVLKLLVETPVLPTLYMASLAGLIMLLCLLSCKYHKTLLALSSRLSPPIHHLPSPVWDTMLLAIPLINLLWIWPSSIRTVHYGKKLCQLYRVPYKGPSLKLALVTSLLLPSLLLCFNLAGTQLFISNNLLHLPVLITIYLYMKKLNAFIDDMSKEHTSSSPTQIETCNIEAMRSSAIEEEPYNPKHDGEL